MALAIVSARQVGVHVEVLLGLHPAAAQRAAERAEDRADAASCLNVIATRPRSSVAAGLRSSGRLPRKVYGLVFSTIVK